jgi:ketosteroid isomerase-like protein
VHAKAELIEALVARMKAADDAPHSGDAGPRKALWSAKEPVTVFGAAMSATGTAETQAAFDWVASRYTGFESARWEILSADVSGDLAYVVAIEHTTTSIGGAPTESYSLRATTICAAKTASGVPSTATPIRSAAASPPATASSAPRPSAPAPGRHG